MAAVSFRLNGPRGRGARGIRRFGTMERPPRVGRHRGRLGRDRRRCGAPVHRVRACGCWCSSGRPVQAGRLRVVRRRTRDAAFRHFVSHRQQVREEPPHLLGDEPRLLRRRRGQPLHDAVRTSPFAGSASPHRGRRTLVWDAVTPRFSDFEFKAASRDGFGPDWPLTHAELAPYYSDLERLLGVHGSRDGLPQLPDGEFLEPRPMTPAEVCSRSEWSASSAIAGSSSRAGSSPAGRPSRARRCRASPAPRRRFAPRGDRAADAPEPGGGGPTPGRARTGAGPSGVEFVDARTGRTEEVRAKLVFLCASTLESVRILMNSRSAAHPRGHRRLLGGARAPLMDHSAGNVYFYLPDVPDDRRPVRAAGQRQHHGSPLPESRHPAGAVPARFRPLGRHPATPVPEFLRRHRDVAFGFLCARSETLPHRDNRVELDPALRDPGISPRRTSTANGRRRISPWRARPGGGTGDGRGGGRRPPR